MASFNPKPMKTRPVTDFNHRWNLGRPPERIKCLNSKIRDENQITLMKAWSETRVNASIGAPSVGEINCGKAER